MKRLVIDKVEGGFIIGHASDANPQGAQKVAATFGGMMSTVAEFMKDPAPVVEAGTPLASGAQAPTLSLVSKESDGGL